MNDRIKIIIEINNKKANEYDFLVSDIIAWNHYGNLTLRDLVKEIKKQDTEGMKCPECQCKMEPLDDRYYYCGKCSLAGDSLIAE